MLTDTQVPVWVKEVADDQLNIYKQGRSIQDVNYIPDTSQIPIENQSHWLKIPDVVCVFVDMKGSTQLSASQHDRGTAGAYQLFTGAAVWLFHAFDTPYVDVRGDGVFGLFNADQVYRAIVAAVTFKTYVREVFTPQIKTDTGLTIGAHIGIDQKTVLVRKLGLKRHGGRSDRQNEVWAGKPINMASKLAAMGGSDELLVSDRYFDCVTDQHVRKSCGCGSETGEKRDLWTERDLTEDPKFDFCTAYCLESRWCRTHGKEYCEHILTLDED